MVDVEHQVRWGFSLCRDLVGVVWTHILYLSLQKLTQNQCLRAILTTLKHVYTHMLGTCSTFSTIYMVEKKIKHRGWELNFPKRGYEHMLRKRDNVSNFNSHNKIERAPIRGILPIGYITYKNFIRKLIFFPNAQSSSKMILKQRRNQTWLCI